jgi:hypothetical protein
VTHGRAGGDRPAGVEEAGGLLIVEAARVFDAEAAALVGVCSRFGRVWHVLSNDPLWPDARWPDAAAISALFEQRQPTLVHFALHADQAGLLLSWSDADDPADRQVRDVLAWEAVRRIPCWNGVVVTTGACGLLAHAGAFLSAGARAVVAPDREILWDLLCHFYRIFYTHLLAGRSLSESRTATLSHAAGYYRDFGSIGVRGEASWKAPSG